MKYSKLIIIMIFFAVMLAVSCKETVEDTSKTSAAPPAETAVQPEAPRVSAAKATEANPPFDRLQYDQVVAYDYEGTIDNDFAIIDENGKLHESVKQGGALHRSR